MLPSEAHVDQLLTDFALGYKPQAGRFVADQIFQSVGVPKQSDKYNIFLPEHADDHAARSKRNADGSYNRIKMTKSDTTFFCDDRGLETEILDPVVANSDTGINAEQRGTLLVTEAILLANEVNAAAIIAATPPTDDAAFSDGSTLQWSHPSADILGQVEDMQNGIEGRTLGSRAQRMLISSDVWSKLKVHPQILARITGGSTVDKVAKVSQQLVADLFEVDQIIIARARKNTANQGANRVFSRIWSDMVLLYVFAETPDLETEAYGIQFNWKEDTGGQKYIVEKYRDERKRSGIIRNRGYFGEKIVGADFAARRTNVIQ